MRIKILSLLLALILIALVACTEGGDDKSKDQSATSESSSAATSDSGSSEAESSEEDPFEDGLPDVNYGGREYTILQRTEFKYEFTSDTTSEKVETLISERNRKVEQRFGVTIKTIEQDGIWGKHVDFMTYVRNTIAGGNADYDVISGYAAIMPSLISEDKFINWYELDEFINFEKPWWSQDFVDELTINGRLYLLSGDLFLTFWDSMQCIFFNKTLADAYLINDLYDTVIAGEWTFEKMFQIIKDTHVESTDPDERIYGYATFLTTQIDVYQDAFDIPVTEKNSEGKPEYRINQQRTYDALEMLYDLIVDTPYTMVCKDEQGNDNTVKFFGEGRSLFAPLALADGATLQNYDTEYGILPMPKFNKEQDDYHSTCRDSYSVLAIPTTSADNLEFIGIITEGLCVESSRSVVPEYYTLVLKERYTKDEESIQMIDIIRKGILCNFGYLYSYTLDWPAHQLNVCINNKNSSFASTWETNESKFEANLNDAIAYYFDE